MRNYLYVVMEDSREADWDYQYGGERPVAVYSSEEEAKAVALVKRKSAERHPEKFDNWRPPVYYVARVISCL